VVFADCYEGFYQRLNISFRPAIVDAYAQSTPIRATSPKM
jgi:hypothetical protein